MKYLLDTHVLIWMLSGKENLSERAIEIIQSSDDLYVSVVSLWEIAIKKSLKRLDLDGSIEEIADMCALLGLHILQIYPEQLDELLALKFHHKDPFDRLLIAQAKSENFIFITKDSIIPKYDIKTLW